MTNYILVESKKNRQFLFDRL